ncbi:methyltransferase [Sorangium sp. So ce1128]
MNMLVNTGGRERTEAEYRALLDAAGLRVEVVRETPGIFRVFEATRA